MDPRETCYEAGIESPAGDEPLLPLENGETSRGT